jgi:hypothetical protein
MVKAALQDLPAGRVERDGTGTAAKPDRLRRLVDVADAQVTDLVAGSTVEQGEDAEQCLVRVCFQAPWSSGGTARAAPPGTQSAR